MKKQGFKIDGRCETNGSENTNANVETLDEVEKLYVSGVEIKVRVKIVLFLFDDSVERFQMGDVTTDEVREGQPLTL